MFVIQKLIRNGHSTQVSIPRPMLDALGWVPGQHIAVELRRDESILLRRPTGHDFRKPRQVRALLDACEPVEP